MSTAEDRSVSREADTGAPSLAAPSLEPGELAERLSLLQERFRALAQQRTIPAEGRFLAPSLAAATLEPDELARRLSLLQDRFRALADNVPAVVYVESVEEDQPMIDVSPGIEPLLGVSREDWLGNPTCWVGLLHPEDRARVVEAYASASRDLTPFREEYRTTTKDGRQLYIRNESIAVRDGEGTPLYRLGFMIDITDAVATQLALSEAKARYGALVEQIPAIVYIDAVDEQMSTTYVSPQIEQILGYTSQEYVQDPDLWAKILHPDDHDAALDQYLSGRASGEPFSFEYRLIARDDRVVWFRDSAVVIPGPDGNPAFVQGVMLDITDRRAAEDRAAFLAYHDELTGLPNRAMFEELLGRAVARAQRHDFGVAVLYLDLDEFKLVNDSLGHEAGDILLRRLSDRLQESTRETDLVARPGGDEFLLLVSDVERGPFVSGGSDQATVVAQSVAKRIQEALREPFLLDETEIYITGSIGVSVFPQDARDAASLLKHADAAMFRSKKARHGGIVIHEDDRPGTVKKLSLSTRLHKAVEAGSWILHYQPIVRLDDARMVGVEALIRWGDPDGSLIPPGDFIPLAEELGLIEAIGDWVVEEIARQGLIWRSQGFETEISLNLSPRQLWQPDLATKIVSRVTEVGLPPERVVVEVTESAAMADPDRAQTVLSELHALGVRIAIDDFGTGYSSLARLKDLPVDILKIDRSFVRDVDADEDTRSMVSAMVALAWNLGITALGEGIETDAQWRFLAELGCELGQGFLFSRPVTPEDILTFCRRNGLGAEG